MAKAKAPKGIDWTSVDWTQPDRVLAKTLGVHHSSVNKARARRGIGYETPGKINTPKLRAELTALDALRGMATRPAETVAPKKPTAPISSKPLHILWASDVHFPEEDPHAWACFLRRAEDAQPDEIVLGGDIMEMEAASRHGGVAQPARIVDEIEYTRVKLAELRALCPDAAMAYLEGNHESRLQRAVVEALPTFDGALLLPDLLGLEGLGCAWHKYGDVIRRGRLGFTHGWWTPLHHAAKHLRECGESIMYGHSHRPQTFHLGGGTGHVRGAYGMPCLRTLDAEWCNGRPHGWAHGWGEVYVDEASGRYNAYTVIVVDGCAIVDGKLYSGRAAR